MNDIIFIDMGKRIKDKRKEKGFSQKRLAEMIGLEYRTLLKWEKGNLNHKIDLPVFLKLCDVLEIDMPYLLGNNYSTRELKTICEYTGLSEKAIKNIRHEVSEAGDSRNILMLDLLLSDKETFISLMQNMISLINPSSVVIDKNLYNKLSNENGDLVISPAIIAKLADETPDSIYSSMRASIDKFRKSIPENVLLAKNEF